MFAGQAGRVGEGEGGAGHAHTRTHIMDAMLTLADQKGHAAMTHRDIATTACVSHSTFTSTP
jgi:DNA-binding transcriptional regulator YbjK